MNYKYIKRMIHLVEESDIESLEVHSYFSIFKPGIKITKSRGVKRTIERRVEEPGVIVETIPSPSVEKPSYRVVKSPMVGSYYRNEKKTRKPLIRKKRKVTAGQILCYIEALKLMNPITSPYSGIVRKICLRKNNQPVEFGQDLFEIEETQEQ